ncbi:MAG: YicC/YloC family endoribonuclease [Phycisphaeraceae bacterium]
MIRSMTGFGDAARESSSIHYALELRSLNNKYFKALVRLPEELVAFEAELESALRKRVQRGSITLTVKIKDSATGRASRINDAVLLSYIDHLEAIRHKVRDHSIHIDLTQLLALPGVIDTGRDPATLMNESRPILHELLERAVERLNEMRMNEGQSIMEELVRQLDVIRGQLEIVRERSPAVVEEYQRKLHERIRELAASAELKVGEADLLKEVAVFADRVDVNEEVQRIFAHVEQFNAMLECEGHEPAGRTLDFIAQELLREANTVAAKSNDKSISQAVVTMKSAIDRIKEQVQNVE